MAQTFCQHVSSMEKLLSDVYHGSIDKGSIDDNLRHILENKALNTKRVIILHQIMVNEEYQDKAAIKRARELSDAMLGLAQGQLDIEDLEKVVQDGMTYSSRPEE